MIYDFVLAETLFMSIKVFYVTLQKIPTLHTPLHDVPGRYLRAGHQLLQGTRTWTHHRPQPPISFYLYGIQQYKLVRVLTGLCMI